LFFVEARERADEAEPTYERLSRPRFGHQRSMHWLRIEVHLELHAQETRFAVVGLIVHRGDGTTDVLRRRRASP
jgi:hypothetical protein